MIKLIFNKLKKKYDFYIRNRKLVKHKQKIFCIGLNKTGTTSLETEMKSLGFITGNQGKGTRTLYDWSKRNFKSLKSLCLSAQFFQDAPFSWPFTFIILDQMFPNSKFILTVRDSPEQWSNSITKFHSKLWGDGENALTVEQLKNAPGLKPGFRYDCAILTRNANSDDLYNVNSLMDFYETHNKAVMEYFRHTPQKLLVINLREKESYKKFCNFLNIKTNHQNFPWDNQTAKIKMK